MPIGRVCLYDIYRERYTNVGIMNRDGQTSVTEAAVLGGELEAGLAFYMPGPVEDLFGYALYLAQDGRKHEQAKPLKGFGSAGVLEVVEDWDRSTYRAVYTVRFEGVVFVLHIFQKKSKRGAATPKADIDLIRERLKVAEQFAKELSR